VADPASEPQHTTITGAVASVSEKLVRALPPAMLVLVLLNVVFLGVSAWTFQHNTDRRADMISKILESCLEHRT